MDRVHRGGHIQNMDRGPWTTPNFQKEIALVNMKIYQRSGYVLEGLSRNSGLLWDRTPINGKTSCLQYSIVHKNKPIYFINKVYPTNTNLKSRYIDKKKV